jgi:hypothetical protein
MGLSSVILTLDVVFVRFLFEVPSARVCISEDAGFV